MRPRLKPLVALLYSAVLASSLVRASPAPVPPPHERGNPQAERTLAPTAAPATPAPEVIVPPTPGNLAASRILRYRALGLPEGRLAEFLGSGRSLTDWYNREHLGGRGLQIGGWTLVVFGAIGVTIGTAFLIVGTRPSCYDCDDDWQRWIATYWIGLPAMVIGLAELAAGLPMALVGMARMKRWVPGDALDRAPVAELEGRREPHARRGAAVAVLPYLAPGGGGVSLSLRF